MDKIKVLYIAGLGRDGSTIVGNILGEFNSLFFAGEVLTLWKYAFIEGGACSCGVPVMDCGIWKSILDEAFGNLSGVEFRELDWLNRQHLYDPAFLEVLLTQIQGREIPLGNPFRNYLDCLDRLYRSIQKATGCSVIVDSSKRPLYADMLEILPSVELYVLHLVRDSRGVVYSWLRNKIKLGVTSVEATPVYMDRYSPFTTAIRWDNRNITFEVFARYLKERYLLLRYEDFVREPQKSIKDILQFIDEPSSGMPFMSDHEVYLHTGHSIQGNPSRFTVGQIPLRPDLEWNEKMRPVDRLLTTALTWPWLRKYGYFSKGKG